MDFGWLKKLFNKQKNTGIAKIDTSFVVVPKLSELSEENRKMAESYLKMINTNNYKSILKYSEFLVKKNNINKELLFNKVSEIREITDNLKNIDRLENLHNEDLRCKCHAILMKCEYLKEQILLLIDEIKNNEMEAELKLIAFNEFVKKENRKKYSLPVITSRDERIKYINIKNSLQEEKERLLIINKVIRYDLYSACRAYESIESNYILNSMEDYVFYIDAKSCVLNPTDYYIHREPYDTTNILTAESMRIRNTLLNVREFSNRGSKVHNGIVYSEDESTDSPKICRYKSNDFYNVLRINASKNIQIEKYAYLHRNDYKFVLKEIKELVDKYSLTFSILWNKDELLEIIRKYTAVIVNYSLIFEKYTTDEIQKELREALFNLNYFYYISCIDNPEYDPKVAKEYEELPSWLNDEEREKYPKPAPRYLNQEKKTIINGNHVSDILDKYNGKKWNYYDEIVYYDKLSMEMLETVEILRLPGIEYNRIKRKNKTILLSLEYSYNGLPALFDVYNHYYNGSNVKVIKSDENDKNWLMKRLVGYSKTLSLEEKNIWNNMVIGNEISAENLFYILKFFGFNDYNYNLNHLVDTFKNSYIKLPVERKINNVDFQKLVIKTVFYKLENEYDQRIIVIPGNIDMSKNSSNVLSEIIEKVNNSNAIGVFVPNLDEIDSLVHLMYQLYNIKYLMIPRDSLSLLDSKTSRYVLEDNVIKFVNKDIKIIIVDDNMQYKDLSTYLDIELDKEKILTKTN